MIRASTTADLSWLLDLAIKCHDAFDIPATERWIAAMLAFPDIIAIRGEHSAAFARVNRAPWDSSDCYCELMHLYSQPDGESPLEAMAVLRAVDAERVKRGANRFYVISTGADLSSFAVRLGGKPCGSVHVVGGQR